MPEDEESFLETTIGHVVKAWRLHRDLTITELAARAGPPITKGYVSQLERDKIRMPGDAKLAQLSRALAVSVRDLVNRELPVQSAGEDPNEDPDEETGSKERSSRQLGPVYPALPAPIIVAEEERIGRRIERLIAAAQLSEEGEMMVAAYVEETTGRLLDLLRSAPRPR